MKRSEMIARLHDRGKPWDMLIIGGGATGVGFARALEGSRGPQAKRS